MTSRQQAARAFAYAAHLGQMYGHNNYISHLDQAVDVLHRFGVDEYLRADIYDATLLHDTLEDTQVTYEDLVAVFGINVANLVDAVTDQKEANRRERHFKTYPRILRAGQDAIMVKLADRIANVEASLAGTKNLGKLKMYQKEYHEFRVALRSPTYFSRVLKQMWEHLDRLLGWKETS